MSVAFEPEAINLRRDPVMQTRFRSLLLCCVVFLCCVGCDQATKRLAKDHLPPATQSYLGGVLRLQYAENSGGFLSLGSTLPNNARFVSFTLFAGCALAATLFFLVTTPKLNVLYAVALSLIIAGGAGNLMDRIFNHGAVVDFLNIGIGSLRTGIFNVADVAVMTGAMLLILRMVQPLRQKKG